MIYDRVDWFQLCLYEVATSLIIRIFLRSIPPLRTDLWFIRASPLQWSTQIPKRVKFDPQKGILRLQWQKTEIPNIYLFKEVAFI